MDTLHEMNINGFGELCSYMYIHEDRIDNSIVTSFISKIGFSLFAAHNNKWNAYLVFFSIFHLDNEIFI